MALFGITGGIGSGKSTVATCLRHMGYAVFNTDSEAQRIMACNPAVRSQVELLFGSDIYNADILKRDEVAKQVFNDPQLLQRLNHIVHPAVKFELQQWANRQPHICFVESAILFESQLNTLCKAVICINAPEDLRIQRTIMRDNKTAEQVKQRIQNQMQETDRAGKSDFIVTNDGQKEISHICLDILDFCRNFAN